ncbi:MAG: transposase [Bacteroidales bacterium]
MNRSTTHNSTYPKGGVLCSKDSFVVNQTFVFQIKFCGKSPALRVAEKRYQFPHHPMPNYNPEIHHRRSIRLKGYNYAESGLYFITLCTQDRAHLFGKIVAPKGGKGKMILNQFGQIAWDEWMQSRSIRDNVKLHEFVVMPNHIHGIVEITANKAKENSAGKFQSPSQTIGSIIRGYKIATIKRIKNLIEKEGEIGKNLGKGELNPNSNIISLEGESSTGELQFAPTIAPTNLNLKIWQRNYYEHIIRDEQSHQRISEYIINNPAKWAEDKFYKSKN